MKKKLYLGTVVFPYGNDERSFIDPEIEYLTKEFDVTIISCPSDESYLKYKNQELKYPDVHFVQYKMKDSLRNVVCYSIKGIFYKAFWEEIRDILCEHTNSIFKILALFKSFIRACAYENFLKQLLKDEKEFLYYSYWNNDLCLGALMYKENHPGMHVVARTHGHDLYNERQACGRQFFRPYMDRMLDAVIFACQYGMDYYIRTFGCKEHLNKYYLCRLGSRKEELQIIEKEETMVIVSCSRAIQLKRIDLIIDALSQIDDIPIKWIHFGDGELYQELCNLAEQKLGKKDNIVYQMPGMVENDDVRRFYQTHYISCFVTMSESEGGCPMAIQEAMMFGIPVIAPSVGGITEMIVDNNLIVDYDQKKSLCQKVRYLWNLKPEEKKLISKREQDRWKEMFDISKNGDKICSILGEIEKK